MNRSSSLATLLLVTFCAVTAVAAAPSTDALIEQGLDLRRDGKPEQALELFRRAHAIAPSPRTFGQMGLVEASLKRWVDGETHLSVSLSNPDDTWVIKNRAFLDEALAQCRQHVGDLVVSGPAGVEVFVGGRLDRDAAGGPRTAPRRRNGSRQRKPSRLQAIREDRDGSPGRTNAAGDRVDACRSSRRPTGCSLCGGHGLRIAEARDARPAADGRPELAHLGGSLAGGCRCRRDRVGRYLDRRRRR